MPREKDRHVAGLAPDEGFGPPVSAWEAARRYGIDMSLIEGNLRKTPAERLRAHNGALKLVVALRNAMRRRHDA